MVEYCKHEIVHGGLCGTCFRSLPKFVSKKLFTKMINLNLWSDERHLRHEINPLLNKNNVFISADSAKNLEKSQMESFLKNKKLALVLDLDRTLIHASEDYTFIKQFPQLEVVVREAEPKIEGLGVIELKNGRFKERLLIKLRPGLEDFLKSASKHFELYLYTHGTRKYAENILNTLIDKQGTYFAHRVLTADENYFKSKKCSSSTFPCFAPIHSFQKKK